MPETVLVAVPAKPADTFAKTLHELWDEGAAVLPFDPSYPKEVTEALFEAARPSVVQEAGERVAFNGGLPIENDVALVIATSGSVGSNPAAVKAAELTRLALEASATASLERLGAAPGDRWLSCLPFNHIAGLSVLTRSITLGADPVIHESFDPALFEEARADYVSLVPAMLRRLLTSDVPLDGFKAILVGGGPVGDDLKSAARDAGANVVATYGMTETCGGCVYDGRPLSGVEVEVDEESRIKLRGPVLMSGYRLREDLTNDALDDGWFSTNDFGRLNTGGILEVTGRADHVIITGGEKVDPAPVERRLTEHPSITAAVVVGIADDKWGEVVAAVIESKEGVSSTEVESHVRASLPPFMVPRLITFVTQLPLTSIGKPDRESARRLLEQVRASGG